MHRFRAALLAAADPKVDRALAKATLRFAPDLTFSAGTDGRLLFASKGCSATSLRRMSKSLCSAPRRWIALWPARQSAGGRDGFAAADIDRDGVRDSGEMLALSFETLALDALLYLDRNLKWTISRSILSAKAQQTGDKAASNAEQLTELAINQSIKSNLRALVFEGSPILELTTHNGDLNCLVQTDVRIAQERRLAFCSCCRSVRVSSRCQIYLNGPTFLKVLSFLKKRSAFA